MSIAAALQAVPDAMDGARAQAVLCRLALLARARDADPDAATPLVRSLLPPAAADRLLGPAGAPAPPAAALAAFAVLMRRPSERAGLDAVRTLAAAGVVGLAGDPAALAGAQPVLLAQALHLALLHLQGAAGRPATDPDAAAALAALGPDRLDARALALVRTLAAARVHAEAVAVCVNAALRSLLLGRRFADARRVLTAVRFPAAGAATPQLARFHLHAALVLAVAGLYTRALRLLGLAQAAALDCAARRTPLLAEAEHAAALVADLAGTPGDAPAGDDGRFLFVGVYALLRARRHTAVRAALLRASRVYTRIGLPALCTRVGAPEAVVVESLIACTADGLCTAQLVPGAAGHVVVFADRPDVQSDDALRLDLLGIADRASAARGECLKLAMRFGERRADDRRLLLSDENDDDAFLEDFDFNLSDWDDFY